QTRWRAADGADLGRGRRPLDQERIRRRKHRLCARARCAKSCPQVNFGRPPHALLTETRWMTTVCLAFADTVSGVADVSRDCARNEDSAVSRMPHIPLQTLDRSKPTPQPGLSS